MTRIVLPWALSAALVALLCWPMSWADGDSFPHSRFPMFSSLRPRVMTVTHALGVLADERRVPLPPLLSSGNRAVLQSEKFVQRGVRTDAPRFCDEVARRVAASDDEDFAGVVAVELATSQFDTVGYFEGAREPLARRVYARCEVRR